MADSQMAGAGGVGPLIYKQLLNTSTWTSIVGNRSMTVPATCDTTAAHPATGEQPHLHQSVPLGFEPAWCTNTMPHSWMVWGGCGMSSYSTTNYPIRHRGHQMWGQTLPAACDLPGLKTTLDMHEQEIPCYQFSMCSYSTKYWPT